jgi:hypothetical protein
MEASVMLVCGDSPLGFGLFIRYNFKSLIFNGKRS